MSSVMGGCKAVWATVAAAFLAVGALAPDEAAAAERRAVRPADKAEGAAALPAKAQKKGKRAAKGSAAAAAKPTLLGGEEAGHGKPGAGKPGAGKPGAGKPGHGKPGHGKPGAGKPGHGKPGHGKPNQAKPNQAKPGHGKPGAAKPGSAKPRGTELLGSGQGGGRAPSAGGERPQGQPPVKGPKARPGLPGPGRPGPRQTTSTQHAKPPAKPEPRIERAHTFAVGARGGSLLSMPSSGVGVASDGGLGLALRYRGLSFLGVEGSFMHFDSDNLLGADAGFPSDRSHNSFSGSVQLFFTPSQIVSPYLSVGGTYQTQVITAAAPDTSVQAGAGPEQNDVRRGLHGGLGVEFALGQHLGLGLEARYLTDAVHPESDPLSKGQVQGLLGLNIYF